MSLTTEDLKAIKELIDSSINEQVPGIIDRQVKPMFDELRQEISREFEDLEIQIGQFSLETTENFAKLDNRLAAAGAKLIGDNDEHDTLIA